MEIHFLELKLFLFVYHVSGFTGILHLSLDALDHYLLVARANLVPLTGDNLMSSSYKDLGLKLAEKHRLQGSNWLLIVTRFLWKIWDDRTSCQPIHLPCSIYLRYFSILCCQILSSTTCFFFQPSEKKKIKLL
jgi:hypothetical protein